VGKLDDRLLLLINLEKVIKTDQLASEAA
jgi:hypothetical protein